MRGWEGRKKYYSDWSHKFHDKKRCILFHLSFLNLYQEILNFETCQKFQKRPPHVPNLGTRERVPNQANVSQFDMSLWRDGVRNLWDNVPKYTFFEGIPK